MRFEMSDIRSRFTAAAASARLDRPLERFALELTMYCNLQCKMCSVWEVRKFGVPLALAKQLLWDARELGARTFLPFGAECFMRKDFLDIVEYAHSLEYSCQPIVTNGTMISAADIDRLSRCRSVVLNISIDGPRDVHDELRGAGNYDKAVATARQCIARRIKVGLSAVIMRETLPHLEALVDLAAELGIRQVSVQPFRTETAGPHKDIARFSFQPDARDTIAARLDALLYLFYRRKFEIYTESLFSDIPDFLAYGKHPIPRGGCSLPSKMLVIDRAGDIYPCFFMRMEADRMGNVFRERLCDVWHSLIHKQFQILALTERCPGCLAASCDVQSFAENAAGN